ncbi:MAG: bifunctional riboflavin kinase/FAD synthetase, partial [Oscillospiraceae bacterium]
MSEQKRVIALGFFDGVHIGHAALMEMTKRRALEKGAIPTVLSFDVHPDTLVKGVEVPLLNAAEGRADIIRRIFGIDSVVFIHFNQTVMQMPWQEFISNLAKELNAAHFVVGHDFSFGWHGEGNGDKLREYCAANGMGCDVIPPVTLDGQIVSSTEIRRLISAGELTRANELLGHPHSLIDTVRYGYQLGIKMGTPTINMQFSEGVLIPRHGVYATKVFTDTGDEHIAVTNVGVRPTFGGENVSVESYILDFDGNLYEHRVRVEFFSFIRPEKKFTTPEELSNQILQDAETTRQFFKN